MQSERETLTTAATNLQLAVSAVPTHGARDWAMRVERALTGVELVLRREDSTLDSADGVVADMGGDLATSAGVGRRLRRLRRGLRDMNGEAKAIRRVLELGAREGLTAEACEDVRRRVSAWVDAIWQMEQEETSLIYECASTDIGAGD